MEKDSRVMFVRSPCPEDDRIAEWLSAALEDPAVSLEMKQDIKDWFETFLWDDGK